MDSHQIGDKDFVELQGKIKKAIDDKKSELDYRACELTSTYNADLVDDMKEAAENAPTR